MNLPSPGPALGAYSMGREVEKVLSHLRVHKMNSDAAPFGYTDLCAFLRAACDEAESYFPAVGNSEPTVVEAPMPPLEHLMDGAPDVLKVASRRKKA